MVRDKAQSPVQELELHPCYSEKAHFQYGRIHLPVAPDCNLGCRYCDRLTGGPSYHSYRPAVCDRVMTPKEALDSVRSHRSSASLRVVGIAGPGEPLYNDESFETFRLVASEFPELLLCASTNGLLVEDRLEELNKVGLSTLTVTVNTVRPETAERLYDFAVLEGRVLSPSDAARAVMDAQMAGIRAAVSSGVKVKVNTILIPGINDGEIAEIARASSEAGACVQNIMPLIPLGRLGTLRPPTCRELRKARVDGGKYLDQFRLCRQCRADSVGIPGREDLVLNRRV